jgi:hypothetical protein
VRAAEAKQRASRSVTCLADHFDLQILHVVNERETRSTIKDFYSAWG